MAVVLPQLPIIPSVMKFTFGHLEITILNKDRERCSSNLIDIKHPEMLQRMSIDKDRETELELQGFFERNEGLFTPFLDHMPASYIKCISKKINKKLRIGQNRENDYIEEQKVRQAYKQAILFQASPFSGSS